MHAHPRTRRSSDNPGEMVLFEPLVGAMANRFGADASELRQGHAAYGGGDGATCGAKDARFAAARPFQVGFVLFFAFGALAQHRNLVGIVLFAYLLPTPHLLNPSLVEPVTETDNIVCLHAAPFERGGIGNLDLHIATQRPTF